MRLAIIADNRAIKQFALNAIDVIEGVDEITVFSCTNTRSRKHWLRHAAYYALNLVTVRNRLTRSVAVDSGKKRVARYVDFESVYDGAWQLLPSEVIAELNAGRFDLILKFGMGLLRVPASQELPTPILSYHHGDPDLYRGRPAGFWEIAEGAPIMGQIVQVIGNRLDAGNVVAFAETKVIPWSYRATLMDAYRHSPLLINSAIRNALAGTYLPKPCNGRNCRLPSNAAVISLLAKMSWQLVRHLAYGATVEKKWKVSTVSLTPQQLDELVSGRSFPPAGQWRTLPVEKGYSFYADPFFDHDRAGILLEAVNARSGVGEILSISGSSHRPLIQEAGHLSYPATARLDDRNLIIPESVNWSEPRVYERDRQGARFVTTLQVQDGARLIDPTLFERDGRIYLFGNIGNAGWNILNLWSSKSLDEPFMLHPASPIRISPKGSRMGGGLIELDSRLIRFGQDFSHGYGDGLIAFEIDQLTEHHYRERAIGQIHVTDPKGPHTANFADGEMVFDWYADRFSPLAGVRRLAAILAQSRAAARLERRTTG